MDHHLTSEQVAGMDDMAGLTEADLDRRVLERCAPLDTTTEAVLQAEAPAPRWTPKPAIWIYRIPLARRLRALWKGLFA
jgi:hypothetical protein